MSGLQGFLWGSTRRKIVTGFGALVFALLLVLSGCSTGGDDDNESAETTVEGRSTLTAPDSESEAVSADRGSPNRSGSDDDVEPMEDDESDEDSDSIADDTTSDGDEGTEGSDEEPGDVTLGVAMADMQVADEPADLQDLVDLGLLPAANWQCSTQDANGDMELDRLLSIGLADDAEVPDGIEVHYQVFSLGAELEGLPADLVATLSVTEDAPLHEGIIGDGEVYQVSAGFYGIVIGGVNEDGEVGELLSGAITFWDCGAVAVEEVPPPTTTTTAPTTTVAPTTTEAPTTTAAPSEGSTSTTEAPITTTTAPSTTTTTEPEECVDPDHPGDVYTSGVYQGTELYLAGPLSVGSSVGVTHLEYCDGDVVAMQFAAAGSGANAFVKPQQNIAGSAYDATLGAFNFGLVDVPTDLKAQGYCYRQIDVARWLGDGDPVIPETLNGWDLSSDPNWELWSWAIRPVAGDCGKNAEDADEVIDGSGTEGTTTTTVDSSTTSTTTEPTTTTTEPESPTTTTLDGEEGGKDNVLDQSSDGSGDSNGSEMCPHPDNEGEFITCDETPDGSELDDAGFSPGNPPDSTNEALPQDPEVDQNRDSADGTEVPSGQAPAGSLNNEQTGQVGSGDPQDTVATDETNTQVVEAPSV